MNEPLFRPEKKDYTTYLGRVPLCNASRKVPSLGLVLRNTFLVKSFAVLAGDLIVLIGEVAMVNDERRLRVRRGAPGCTVIWNGDSFENEYSESRGCEARVNPAVKKAEYDILDV